MINSIKIFKKIRFFQAKTMVNIAIVFMGDNSGLFRYLTNVYTNIAFLNENTTSSCSIGIWHLTVKTH